MSHTIRTKPEPSCPACGARMVLRTRRSDGDKFWGCPQFPICRGALNIGSDGLPETDDDELPTRKNGGHDGFLWSE